MVNEGLGVMDMTNYVYEKHSSLPIPFDENHKVVLGIGQDKINEI